MRCNAAGCSSQHLTAAASVEGEGKWADGPEDGGSARAAAARCCAELAGNGDAHAALVETGLADALAEQGAELVSTARAVNASLLALDRSNLSNEWLRLLRSASLGGASSQRENVPS